MFITPVDKGGGGLIEVKPLPRKEIVNFSNLRFAVMQAGILHHQVFNETFRTFYYVMLILISRITND